MSKKILISLTLILTPLTSAFASSDGGHSGIMSLLWYFINFFTFFIVLYLLIGKKVSEILVKRSNDVATQVLAGERELDLAKEKLSEVDERLAKLPEELQALKFEYSNLLAERVKEIEELKKADISRLEEQSGNLVEVEKRKMEKELKLKLVDYVVSKSTEKMAKNTNKDNDQTRREESFRAFAESIK